MIWRVKPFEIIGRKSTVAGAAAAIFLCAPAAMAQEPAPDTEVVAPWYEAFTLSMAEAPTPELEEGTTYDLELGERWGVTLGFQDRSDTRLSSDLSAGAFVTFGDRIRLGGQVRFASPDDSFFVRNADDEERQPEIKFESALRF
ncbi:NtrZ family periplasmic regulatory protein [Maricaulis sp.]|uniref:NtrZ family periplasmic regulatory protein n=1 Tax=Maricaulis sp. TaxID=1486257 RepID=UPI0025C38670|nr:hypothetical protein [Maricaulis sp.]